MSKRQNCELSEHRPEFLHQVDILMSHQVVQKPLKTPAERDE